MTTNERSSAYLEIAYFSKQELNNSLLSVYIHIDTPLQVDCIHPAV